MSSYGIVTYRADGTVNFDSTDIVWMQIDQFTVEEHSYVTNSYPVIAGMEVIAQVQMVNNPPDDQEAYSPQVVISGTQITVQPYATSLGIHGSTSGEETADDSEWEIWYEYNDTYSSITWIVIHLNGKVLFDEGYYTLVGSPYNAPPTSVIIGNITYTIGTFKDGWDCGDDDWCPAEGYEAYTYHYEGGPFSEKAIITVLAKG